MNSNCCSPQLLRRFSAQRRLTKHAFTRLELLAVLAAVGLLAVLTLPLLAASRPNANQAVCFNNLRQIGRAWQMWGNDHDDRRPWEVSLSNGGTKLHMLGGNAWYQYDWISNELVTPKILVCPNDKTAGLKVASNWGNMNGNGGFIGSTFRHNSISHSIGLHAQMEDPLAPLALDYYFQFNAFGAGCEYTLVSVPVALMRGSSQTAWTNGFGSVNSGNVLLADGRVVSATTAEFRQIINRPTAGGQAFDHFLPAH